MNNSESQNSPEPPIITSPNTFPKDKINNFYFYLAINIVLIPLITFAFIFLINLFVHRSLNVGLQGCKVVKLTEGWAPLSCVLLEFIFIMLIIPVAIIGIILYSYNKLKIPKYGLLIAIQAMVLILFGATWINSFNNFYLRALGYIFAIILSYILYNIYKTSKLKATIILICVFIPLLALNLVSNGKKTVLHKQDIENKQASIRSKINFATYYTTKSYDGLQAGMFSTELKEDPFKIYRVSYRSNDKNNSTSKANSNGFDLFEFEYKQEDDKSINKTCGMSKALYFYYSTVEESQIKLIIPCSDITSSNNQKIYYSELNTPVGDRVVAAFTKLDNTIVVYTKPIMLVATRPSNNKLENTLAEQQYAIEVLGNLSKY